ncbi:MAG: SDR family oxidoreductase [Bacteroidia bacterium]|nr:SDR family oxidoreductase [Bacteroidia bacterium]
MNKNIVLTGASKGLGLEIAKELLQNGCNVYAINRSLTSELERLKNQFPENLFIDLFDLSDSKNIKEKVFKNFLSYNVKIDGFVNNAALAYDEIITNTMHEPLDKMFNLNVFAPMLMTSNIIRNMLFHKTKGSIIHISSISVHTGYKGLSMYAASKGALEAYSKNTAREWGEIGIRSNCIVAGFMETEMSATLTDEQKNRIYKRTSLKEATDLGSVAKTISFLLADDSKSITGQNIFVDSGTI